MLHQFDPYPESEVICLKGSHTCVFICDNKNKDEIDMWGLETDVSRNMAGRERELLTLDPSQSSALKAR